MNEIKEVDFSNVQIGLRMFTFYAQYDTTTKTNCKVFKVEDIVTSTIITIVTNDSRYLRYYPNGKQYSDEGQTLFLENPIKYNPINSVVVSGFIGIHDLLVNNYSDYGDEMLAITTNIYKNKKYIEELDGCPLYKIIPISYKVEILNK